MVDTGGLENRFALTGNGGSNPSPSAIRRIALATQDPNDPSSVLKVEKTLSNIQEVTARSGRALAIEGDSHIGQIIKNDPSDNSEARVIHIPPAHELLLPILEVVPVQLLAYHIAVRRGCDVDQPRNLAKSVTVE